MAEESAVKVCSWGPLKVISKATQKGNLDCSSPPAAVSMREAKLGTTPGVPLMQPLRCSIHYELPQHADNRFTKRKAYMGNRPTEQIHVTLELLVPHGETPEITPATLMYFLATGKHGIVIRKVRSKLRSPLGMKFVLVRQGREAGQLGIDIAPGPTTRPKRRLLAVEPKLEVAWKRWCARSGYDSGVTYADILSYKNIGPVQAMYFVYRGYVNPPMPGSPDWKEYTRLKKDLWPIE